MAGIASVRGVCGSVGLRKNMSMRTVRDNNELVVKPVSCKTRDRAYFFVRYDSYRIPARFISTLYTPFLYLSPRLYDADSVNFLKPSGISFRLQLDPFQ